MKDKGRTRIVIDNMSLSIVTCVLIVWIGSVRKKINPMMSKM